MPVVPPTFDELYTRFREQMTALGFTHWAEGSRIGAIGRVQAAYLQDLWTQLAALDDQSNPSTARGIYLDRIGEMFGVQRLPPQTAGTLGQGPSVQFTNNGGAPYTVPGNTRVWNPSQPDIGYFTVGSVAVPAGGQAFVHVNAGQAGERANIGSGLLSAHNSGAQLTVTNVRPIGGGALVESDESYRFRIKESLSARNGATEAALRQAVLKVPGVREVLINPGVRGNGTVDVIVVPVDREASLALLANCEAAVADAISAGTSWRVKAPTVRRVNLTLQLRLQPGALLANVKVAVEAAVRGYLDNLRVNDGGGGSELIYGELLSRAFDADPGVLDVALSLAVESKPILQGNYTPQPGERLVSGAVSIT